MNLSQLTFSDLKQHIISRLDVVFDIEFARRIANRMEQESNFFYGEYCIPFLNDIAHCVAHENCYRDIMGFFWEYTSAPLIKDTTTGREVPQFKLLTGYRGQRGAHLYTYVMVCTWRKAVKYFDRTKPGSLVLGRTRSYNPEQDFIKRIGCPDEESFYYSDNKEIGWEILNAFLYEEVEDEGEHIMRINKMKKAFTWLQEKDRLTLTYLVIEDKSGLEAFKLLKQHLRPKSKNEDISQWTDIQKQNAMSLWKTRALKRLESIVKDPNFKA